jgi:hypothetical protein
MLSTRGLSDVGSFRVSLQNSDFAPKFILPCSIIFSQAFVYEFQEFVNKNSTSRDSFKKFKFFDNISFMSVSLI